MIELNTTIENFKSGGRTDLRKPKKREGDRWRDVSVGHSVTETEG